LPCAEAITWRSGDVLARCTARSSSSSVDDRADQISAFEIRRLRLEQSWRESNTDS